MNDGFEMNFLGVLLEIKFGLLISFSRNQRKTS